MIDPVMPALRRTAAIVIRHPRGALWTLAQLACAAFLIGLAATIGATVERWAAAHPGGGSVMVVYLGDGVDETQATALVAELRGLRGVSRAELISAADSATRLTRALGADASLLDGVDPKTLPASVEVTLAPGVRDVAALSPTVRALRGVPGVADVVVESGAEADAGPEDRIAAMLTTARTVGWTGAALLAGLALIIMFAALRLRLERSPRETAVLAMLGASSGFAAIPIALAGALLSAVAAAVAALALAVAAHGLPATLGSVEIAAPSTAALAGLVALGALVGLIGGCLAGVARAP
jgi:cell division protein FtsX